MSNELLPTAPDVDDDGIIASNILKTSEKQGTKSPSPEYVLTATDRKEFQRLIAVYVYDSLTESMTEQDQMASIFESFHGKGSKTSQIDLLLRGETVYRRLYKNKDIEDDVDTIVVNPDKDSSLGPKTIHSYYSPNGGTKPLTTGKHLTVNSIETNTNRQDTNSVVSGRRLLHMAKETIRNGKKAMAYATQFLHDGNLPSGQTIDDLLSHVKDEMYREMNPQNPKRQDSWTFNGYIAFALFGCPCLVNDDDKLGVYCFGSEKEGKLSSRSVVGSAIMNEKKKRKPPPSTNPQEKIDRTLSEQEAMNKTIREASKQQKLSSQMMLHEQRASTLVSDRGATLQSVKMFHELNMIVEKEAALLRLKKIDEQLTVHETALNHYYSNLEKDPNDEYNA